MFHLSERCLVSDATKLDIPRQAAKYCVSRPGVEEGGQLER